MAKSIREDSNHHPIDLSQYWSTRNNSALGFSFPNLAWTFFLFGHVFIGGMMKPMIGVGALPRWRPPHPNHTLSESSSKAVRLQQLTVVPSP